RTLVEERGPEPSELGEPATDVVCRRLRAPRARRAFAEEVQRGGRGGEFTGSTDQPSFDAVEPGAGQARLGRGELSLERRPRLGVGGEVLPRERRDLPERAS